MSYAEELQNTARGLTYLAVNAATELSELDLDVALSARRAVLDLLSTVQRYLVPLSPSVPWLTVPGTAVHPVAALGQALARYPQPPSRLAPLDALEAPVSSSSGRIWQQVSRHATLAHADWIAGTPFATDDITRWTGIADVAAMASLLSNLDIDLAEQAQSLPGRTDVAAALWEGRALGLGLVAREVAWLASCGPLDGVGPDPQPIPRPRVIPVQHAADVVPAIREVAGLLRTAAHVRPERLRLIAITHARICGLLADAFEASGRRGKKPADLLKQHAERLARSVTRQWPMASLSAGDGLAAQQADGVYFALRLNPQLASELVHDPAELGSALAETTRELSVTADRHLTEGAWITPFSSHRAPAGRDKLPPGWKRSTGIVVPRPFSHLREAAAHSTELVNGLARAGRAKNQRVAGGDRTVRRSAPPAADPGAPRPPPAAPPRSSQTWRDVGARRTPVRRPATPDLPVINLPRRRR